VVCTQENPLCSNNNTKIVAHGLLTHHPFGWQTAKMHQEAIYLSQENCLQNNQQEKPQYFVKFTIPQIFNTNNPGLKIKESTYFTKPKNILNFERKTPLRNLNIPTIY